MSKRKYIESQDITDDRFHEYDLHEFKTGYDFEKYCAELLTRNGYQNVRLTQHNDRGVDILAEKDDKLYAFQCKLRSNSKIPRSAVQEIYAGMTIYKADVGVIIANTDLTKGAYMDAHTLGIQTWSEFYIRLLSDK